VAKLSKQGIQAVRREGLGGLIEAARFARQARLSPEMRGLLMTGLAQVFSAHLAAAKGSASAEQLRLVNQAPDPETIEALAEIEATAGKEVA
jgi:hypothetical protein